MAPAWWDIDQLPWKDMRVNHKVWYPFLLADRPYRGVYWYETRSSVEHGTKNAQRETVKEIWVEDLTRRCVQFGDRPLLGNSSSQEDAEEQKRLGMYATQLELTGACYLPEDCQAQNTPDRSEPRTNRLLDEKWIREAIAQIEREWLATNFP